jgi:hypothetical protein
LTFDHYQGAFAYDVSQYPAPAGLFKLSSKAAGTGFSVGPWSPDGRWLLYQDLTDLFCRDMSQPEPGAPMLIASAVADRDRFNLARLSWSADSKSVALATGSSLVTFDPTHPGPKFNTVSSSIRRRVGSRGQPTVLSGPRWLSRR